MINNTQLVQRGDSFQIYQKLIFQQTRDWGLKKKEEI